MTKRNLAMVRTCDECPWLRSSMIGRFPPERFEALRDTCEPGGVAQIFACHKTEADERACAGMLLVCGRDVNMVRLLVIEGLVDLSKVTASGPLYDNYDEMARANGCNEE